MKFFKQFYQSSKIYQIFVRILTATAILGIAAWIILAIFVGGRAQSAPLTYHEVQNGVNYKARIRFESLEFLLRSRTISRIDVVQIAWADGVNPAAISEIKAQNRYLAFVITEPISANTENIGVLSYTISFTPLIKTICVYYFALMLGVFVLLCVWRYARAAFLTLCGFYIFAALALAAFPAPFAFIGLGGFILCVLCALKTRNSRVKLALSYFSVLPLCLGVGEIYAYLKIQPKSSDVKTQYPKIYWTDNNITGYGVLPNVSGKSISRNERTGEILYDINYSTNENGWRKVATSNANSSKCFVFFGDSFTYGEGVNDDETLSFLFGKEMKDYQIFNFGYHGYGPHQALALLQSGEVERILGDKCESVNGLYENITDHIKRANGFSAWEQGNKNAPRFKLENGKAVWVNIDKNVEQKPKFTQKLAQTKYGRKSYLLELLAKNRYSFKQEHNELYFAILEGIKSELETRLNANFTLFLWDPTNLSEDLEKREFEAILAWLETSKIQYFLMSQTAEDYTTNRLKYGIHADDLHPNALANEKIAKFLAQKIKNGEIKAGKVR